MLAVLLQQNDTKNKCCLRKANKCLFIVKKNRNLRLRFKIFFLKKCHVMVCKMLKLLALVKIRPLSWNSTGQ